MGKRAREKKLAKIQEVVAEKQIVEERKRERLAPLYAMTRKFLVTLIATIALLYMGVIINHHLAGITSRLLRARL